MSTRLIPYRERPETIAAREAWFSRKPEYDCLGIEHYPRSPEAERKAKEQVDKNSERGIAREKLRQRYEAENLAQKKIQDRKITSIRGEINEAGTNIFKLAAFFAGCWVLYSTVNALGFLVTVFLISVAAGACFLLYGISESMRTATDQQRTNWLLYAILLVLLFGWHL